MFQSIVWSSDSLPLRQFVDKYTLPQLVKVEEGIYSQDDLKTISTGQILTIHFTKRTDKLVINAGQQKEYVIPVNCPCKVEVLPTICEDRYYSIEDVLHDFPKFIRVVSDGPPSLALRAGDILELKNTVEENHSKFLECERQDKTRDRVRLPLNLLFAFEPLERTGEYHLQELLQSLPVRVKFTSSNTTIEHENQEIPLRSLGSVILKEKREESTIIASSREEGIVTVLTIPADLDVDVLPAFGAIVGDKTYARFCQDIHDGTELEKVQDVNSFKLSEVDDNDTVEMLYDYYDDDYEEVKPVVPPRCPRRTSEDEECVTPITPTFTRYAASPVSEKCSSRESNPAGKPKLTECPPPVERKAAKRHQTAGAATSSPAIPERPRGSNEENYTKQNSPHNSVAAGAGPNEENLPPIVPPRSPPSQIPQTSDDSENIHDGTDLKKVQDVNRFKFSEVHDNKTAEMLYDNHYYEEVKPIVPPRSPRITTGNPDVEYLMPWPVTPTQFMRYAPSPVKPKPPLPYVPRKLSNEAEGTPPVPRRPANGHQTLGTATSSSGIPERPQGSKEEKYTKPNLQKRVSVGAVQPADKRNERIGTSAKVPSNGGNVDSHPQDAERQPGKHLDNLSVSAVGEWLTELGMSQYVDIFAKNTVDGELMSDLNDEIMVSLGVENALHRKKLKKFINEGWSPKM